MSTRLVYFIKPAEAIGPIKIGVSDRVESRLRDLQFASPVALEIAAVVPGGYAKERSLHDRFASARLHGEWFSPVPELRGYVAALRGGAGDAESPRERVRDYVVTPLKRPGIFASGIRLTKQQLGLLVVVRSFYDFHGRAPAYADLCDATKLTRLKIHAAIEGLRTHKLVSLSPSPAASAIHDRFPVRSPIRVAA